MPVAPTQSGAVLEVISPETYSGHILQHLLQTLTSFVDLHLYCPTVTDSILEIGRGPAYAVWAHARRHCAMA
jgi:hypothetical protein